MIFDNVEKEKAMSYDINVNFERQVVEVIYVDFERLTPEIQHQVIEYGLKQLLNDAGSGAKTRADKVEAARKRLETLESGQWAARRKSAEGFGPFALYVLEEKGLWKKLAKAFKAWGVNHSKKDIFGWLRERGAQPEDWVTAIPNLEAILPKYKADYQAFLDQKANEPDVDVSDINL